MALKPSMILLACAIVIRLAKAIMTGMLLKPSSIYLHSNKSRLKAKTK